MRKIFHVLLFIATVSVGTAQNTDTLLTKRIQLFVDSFINQKQFEKIAQYKLRAKVRIDTIVQQKDSKQYTVKLSRTFGDVPFREYIVDSIYARLKQYVGTEYKKYKFDIHTAHNEISGLIPNNYRSKSMDKSRLPAYKNGFNVVTALDNKSTPQKGLNKRNIALWQSHGWYYEPTLDRWEWQRARLFTTVEDKYTMSVVLPYLVPMLENAGANVFMPRERDPQINEVIVDNDKSSNKSEYKEDGKWKKANTSAFGMGEPPYTDENPFRLGTAKTVLSSKNKTAEVSWIPDIPESGEYAVYVAYQSFDNSVDDAVYTVYHSGGTSRFAVNQKAGGGTWIYLGKFKFPKGKNHQKAKVVLTNKSDKKGRIVSADAVKFGGGMGNIMRGGKISGKPRYLEGSRYYLQYAGMPDTLVWLLNENNDYSDDYQSRGEWANYLFGAPYGPTKHPETKGLGIPIDLTFAFHTDAGISKSDTVIGTLAIYSANYKKNTFPDKRSKLASRDLTDIVQTQIVDDLRAIYDPAWTRRGLWDENYSEAWRPAFPAMLLELFSHQNFGDMKFGHEPQFKFDVARAIYKGMLKFLAYNYGYDYVVQPLPVTSFAIQFQDKKSVELTWKPQIDSLEETAKATQYIVYKRTGKNGFDNGKLTNTNSLIVDDLEVGKTYSFRVTAVNSGGESMPSEELSVCTMDNNKPVVLIVNGFDRIGGKSYVDTDKFAGFTDFDDMGVPDNYDLSYTGMQYDFNPNSEWLDDDSPGFGASYANHEDLPIAGNTHNFSFIHGEAIKNSGYSFVSVSDEASADIDWTKFGMVDYILGEERETKIHKSNEIQFDIYPQHIQQSIEKYCNAGGKLFISGAYTGTDLLTDSTKRKFAETVLKYQWRTNHAVTNGAVVSVNKNFMESESFSFNKQLGTKMYMVEAPDAIEPASETSAVTLLRYPENNTSAAVGYKDNYGVVVLGFPFETICTQKMRNKLMKSVIEYLETE